MRKENIKIIKNNWQYVRDGLYNYFISDIEPYSDGTVYIHILEYEKRTGDLAWVTCKKLPTEIVKKLRFFNDEIISIYAI